MTNNQIAREIINKLRTHGIVKVENSAFLAYGKEIKAISESSPYKIDGADSLDDNTIYWWGDEIVDVDWMYLVENGNIRNAQSVNLLAEKVRDYSWSICC